MLANVYDGMEAYGSAYSNWGMLAMNMTYPYYEVAITGGNWKKLSGELNTYYQPNKVLMGGEKGELPLIQGKFGKISTIFVCVNKACQMPVQEVPQALLQMKSN